MKTKALISFAVTAKLICAFVFAYADCWFSNEAAHLLCLVCVLTHQKHLELFAHDVVEYSVSFTAHV